MGDIRYELTLEYYQKRGKSMWLKSIVFNFKDVIILNEWLGRFLELYNIGTGYGRMCELEVYIKDIISENDYRRSFEWFHKSWRVV